MTAYMYYTPNDGSTANDASFYKKSWLATLRVAASFQSIVYAIIKITRRGTIVPLYEFAAKQPKKNLK